MVQKTDPSNNAISYTYDPTTGKFTSSTDPNNMVKRIAYIPIKLHNHGNRKGWRVWIHNYYGEFNVPLATTDPYGNKTTYTYDSNNNLLSITYPNGTSKSFTYDSNHNVTHCDRGRAEGQPPSHTIPKTGSRPSRTPRAERPIHL